jgi:hypothetical protein
VTFKQATWDYVQDKAAATTKWGDIGDWDTSGVGDFSYAFTQHRNEAGGSYVANGNPKAATFVGTAISKWNTASTTNLAFAFKAAVEMNADLSGWKVGKVNTLDSTFQDARQMNSDLSLWNVAEVTTLYHTFYTASKFTGTGIDTWDVAKVKNMQAFAFATSLTSCSKRKIADAWKGNTAFAATLGTDWAADTCTVRFEYRAAR